ncbi:uncharacterized protein LOC132639947 [Lycium barbarum]|uniref:uncharacterized protein LOC132639947 n=1 Tax=Lycium barbarum TaxID=112863 RepID=UPI00293F4424|nr:uncharacterized protein LOC132639947 [Lycium barbarum]
MLIALSAKNKLGYIEGDSTIPSSDTPEFKLWSRCNDMVTSWLLNSLSKEIAGSVIYSKSAKKLWKDLEDNFGQPNGALLYHLQKELADLVQGSSDIAGYCTKMKKIWDELDTLYTKVTCSCNYNCGGKEKMNKALQDERLVQFLMGLNDVYAPGRSNILMMSPLPSVNLAYSLLMQDEKQRESFMNTHFPGNSSSFMAAQQNPMINANSSVPANSNSFMASQQYPIMQRTSNSDFRGKKNNLVCSNCKKSGHSVDKCYRIIGFPGDFKFTKSTKNQGAVKGNAAMTTPGQNGGETSQGGNNSISQDQFLQMMQLFQNAIQNTTSSDAHANVIQCAGPFNEDPSGSW